MSKIELSPLPSGFATTAALNARLDQIEDEFNDKVLYRSNPEGEPNAMDNTLDMADHNIINLPDATEDHHAIPYGQYQQGVAQEVNDQLTDQMLLVGTGNVVGPLASVNDQVALFNGITGKLLKAGLTIAQYLFGYIYTLENVAVLPSFTPVAGQVYYLKEYNAGTGVGGGKVVGKSGMITPNNVTTFACTAGTYVERINIPEEIPAEFGGAHTGLANCKAAIELVANYIYNRGGGVVTLGPGQWNCSSLVLPTNVGTPFYAGKIVHLMGAGKNATTLNITGSSGISYDTDNSNAAYGGIISNMRLLNSGTATDGIYIPFGTQFHVSDMTIQGFLNSGIKTTHDIWLSSVQRCHIGGLNVGLHGIQMLASGTSNYFDQIFVSQTTDYAYRLGGGYSHVGTLAADDCGSGAVGSTVYLFNGLTGHVGSLGAEINDAENIVHVLNSDVSIGAFYFISNTVSSTKGTALLTQGGSCKVDIVSIVDNTTPSVANKMFKSISGKTIVGSIISDVTYTTESGNSASGSEFLQINNKTSALALRTGGSRSYLGYDRKGNNANYLFGTVKSVAIFTDSLGSPSVTSDAVNRRFEVGAEIGDWFIESRPDLYPRAAYIARASSADLNAISEAVVPIVIGGNTAGRPTNKYLYMQYVDNTLNKIIWWDGTNWRDAMGTIV